MKNPKVVITDNRNEYYNARFAMGSEFHRQRLFAKENYQIDLMMGKIKISK